jgi:hypothetical protein
MSLVLHVVSEDWHLSQQKERVHGTPSTIRQAGSQSQVRSDGGCGSAMEKQKAGTQSDETTREDGH